MIKITYPDGSQLTSTAQSSEQLQTIFQHATALMIGLLADPIIVQVTTSSGASIATVDDVSRLYIGTLIVSSGITAGTTIIGVNITNSTITLSSDAIASGQQPATISDPYVYAKVKSGWPTEGQPGPPLAVDNVTIMCVPLDTPYSRLRDNVGIPSSGLTITQQDVFTRAWKTAWTFYGPNAVNNSKLVQSALIKVPYFEFLLAQNSLFVNPDIEEPLRIPEEYQGQWWNRVDLEAHFNEEITETLTVGIVQSVEVKVLTKNGQVADFTVTP